MVPWFAVCALLGKEWTVTRADEADETTMRCFGADSLGLTPRFERPTQAAATNTMTTPAPALGAAADEAATTPDEHHVSEHDAAGGSGDGPTRGSSGEDTTERSRIDLRRLTGQNAPRGEEWEACALNPSSSMSILRQATGDDGGGGCDDGSGGCDGDGCGGGDGPRWMHGLDAPPSGCGWRECK